MNLSIYDFKACDINQTVDQISHFKDQLNMFQMMMMMMRLVYLSVLILLHHTSVSESLQLHCNHVVTSCRGAQCRVSCPETGETAELICPQGTSVYFSKTLKTYLNSSYWIVKLRGKNWVKKEYFMNLHKNTLENIKILQILENDS